MPVPQCLGSGRVMGGFPFAYAPQPPRKPHRTERRTQRGTRHEVDLEKARSAVSPRAARPARAGGLDRPGSRRKPLSLPISACYTTTARMMLRFLSGVGHAENHHFIPAR